MNSDTEVAPGLQDHDHAACVSSALTDAEDYCRQRGLRLTPTRRRVLEIVWRGHEPVKAYDILDELNRSGRKATPPTVYRALDFLTGASLVHRIDSLNAFVGCPLARGEHTAQLLVCGRCETVTEIDDPAIRGILERGAARHGFALEPQTIEVRGTCPRCLGRTD